MEIKSVGGHRKRRPESTTAKDGHRTARAQQAAGLVIGGSAVTQDPTSDAAVQTLWPE